MVKAASYVTLSGLIVGGAALMAFQHNFPAGPIILCLAVVPLTGLYFAKRRLKSAVQDLILFAEVEEKPVAVSVTIPNYNEVLNHLNGSLGLMGFAKFAYYRRKVRGLRALVFGVLKEYRKAGLHALLYYESEKAAQRLGYHWCELSWNLEDNYEINSFDVSLGAEIYKKYRIYEIDL